ncbi:MAG TPA: response regulator [Thermohalobaculum sp.]|nr:response regulator [Thermohalobaculum sp.]
MTEPRKTRVFGPDSSTGLRLAVVDDEAEFRSLVRRVSEPLGWTVVEYENGRKLIDDLARPPYPDLILLDMVMPHLDGIETVSWLASTSHRCPIILVSGKLPAYSDVAVSVGEARGLEIIDVLRKPVEIGRLREALSPDRLGIAARSRNGSD